MGWPPLQLRVPADVWRTVRFRVVGGDRELFLEFSILQCFAAVPFSSIDDVLLARGASLMRGLA